MLRSSSLILSKLDAARSAIIHEPRTFTGGFHFTDEGEMIMNPKRPGEAKYVGKPSREIDAAWMTLLNG